MRAYAARDAFLVGQKMMLSRERKEGKLEGIEEGMKKGKLEGIKEGKISIAKSMKAENIDIETIKRITGLSIEEIRKL